jgi:FkbM family methyltransferase
MIFKSDRETRAWLAAARSWQGAGVDFLEQIISAIYSATLKPGDLAIDCGASAGLHTMPMSDLVGPSGRVVAIEAVPELAEDLALRVRTSGHTNVEVVGKAIGSREGEASFVVVKGDTSWSGLRQRHDLPPGAASTVVRIEVRVTTLDRLLVDSRQRIRFIKMDLEGGEYHALQGATSLLTNHRPLIVFENCGEPGAKLYDYTREDWFAVFERADLVVFDLFGTPLTFKHWAFHEPWYAIAAARGSDDERFVRSDLPGIIRTAYKSWRRERFRGRLRRAKQRIRQWIK